MFSRLVLKFFKKNNYRTIIFNWGKILIKITKNWETNFVLFLFLGNKKTNVTLKNHKTVMY